MKPKLAAALAALLALTIFSGCAEDRLNYQYTFVSMSVFPVLSVACTPSEKPTFDQTCSAIRELLDSVEGSLSATDETSCVGRFNAAAAGERVEIDRTTYDVLRTATEIYEQTDGFYNPAVYYSVQAYGFGGSSSRPESAQDLPSAEELAAYTELCSHFGELVLESVNGAYYVTKPAATVEIGGIRYAMKIDLGGIGKGYATDLADGLLREVGLTYGYFNFASSSIALGKNAKADDGNYVLGLTNPRVGQGFPADYARLRASDCLISTSGDYEQVYEIGGERYCHIIDPKTGAPVRTGVIAATLLGGNAAENDAYTTALLAMGAERAEEFIRTRLADRKVVLVAEDGEGYTIITNVQDLVVVDGRYEVVNRIAE